MVMLRLVEFNVFGDLGIGEFYQCWFYYVIVIDKMLLFYFVECYLNMFFQFGQDYDFDVFVFQLYGMIIFFFVGIFNFFDDWIWIYDFVVFLVDMFFQEYWVFFRVFDVIGREQDVFFLYINIFFYFVLCII